jgi:hypothetical protein
MIVFTARNKEMAGRKSDKHSWMNYTNQPIARKFFDVTSSVQLLATKDQHDFFSLKP